MDRILLLGEGNFSFTRSLCESLSLIHSNNNKKEKNKKKVIHYHITTTSYDTQQEVVRKYPEANNHFSFLTKVKNVTIKHNIDALESLSTQLETSYLYDYIIFNFPHIGKEDCQLHKCFLGHLLNRVKEVLTRNGLFYLTLAEGQAENWCLSEMVQKQHYSIMKTSIFDPINFPYYEMKRHQIGKSFKQRVSSHQTFVLKCQSCEIPSSEEKEDIFEIVMSRNHEDVLDQIKTTTKADDKVDRNKKKVKNKKVKKRKMIELTAGMYKKVSNISVNDLTTDVVASSFRCISCLKEFPTEQGVRTHVYAEHVLEKQPAKYQLKVLENVVQDESVAVVTEDNCYQCKLCSNTEKVYSNMDALYQHVTAKHQISADFGVTSDGNLLCDVVVSKSPTENMSGNSDIYEGDVSQEQTQHAEVFCGVCGVTVTSQDNHLAALKPPDIQCFTCQLCGRSFQSKRSIEQHERFCQIQKTIDTSKAYS